MMDTHLFVYPSLSRYLLLETGIAIMAATCLGVCIAKQRIIVMTKLEIFFFTWIIYVLLHGFMSPTCEEYRTIYLCVTLAFPFILANMQRNGLLTRGVIVSVLLIVAFIQLLNIIGQHVGLLDSGNKYFSVTGCNENPTVTALYLVGCLPMIISRISAPKAKSAYSVFLLVTIYGIVILRCRTAYIGVYIELMVFLVMRYGRILRNLIKRPFVLYTFGIIFLLFVITANVGLYNMKRDSADGRRLIWRLSVEMITQKPLGYGYGLFERNYNLKQADYFSKGSYTETEERNASYVFMPYNDYIEHGVEGGIAGMLILFSFYAMMIKKSYQRNMKEDTAVFCSFAVMSLFNFIYTAILPWLLLMCYTSFVVSKEENLNICKRLSQYAQYALIVAMVLVSLKIIKMTAAQIRLKQLSDQSLIVNDEEYGKIEKDISTSEAYWTKRAINNIYAKCYNEALENIRCARTYSSAPLLFMVEHHCLEKTGRIDESRKCLDTLSHMAPRRFHAQHQ